MPPSDTRTNLRPSDSRDRPRERRLADARRADEAQDRPLDVGVQLAHREVFEDAVLRLLEARVIGVEHLLWSSADRSPRRSACSTAARPASRGRCARRCIRRRRPASSTADRARAALPSSPARACPPLRSSRRAPRFPSSDRRLRRAPSESPSSARAGSTRAGSCRPRTAPATESSIRARAPRAP